MDKPDTQLPQNSASKANGEVKGAFGKKFVLAVLIFWVLVAVAVVAFRLPIVIGQLAGGGEDRPLLAIESASLQGGELLVEFRGGAGDQPCGVFVVGGHLPSRANASSQRKDNSIGGNHLVFNGESFEILFEAVDPARLPGRANSLRIDWDGRERGLIRLDLSGSFAVEEIRANRAFLVLARTPSDYRAASILSN